MIKELIHDPMLLARKSAPAAKEDLQIAADLLDTLIAHKDSCVGMAANMIGENKNIICIAVGISYLTMFNAEILSKDGAYDTFEGCLSLLGAPRKCKRYKKIKVKYQSSNFETRVKTFTDFEAQIIQHEIDHTNGILI